MDDSYAFSNVIRLIVLLNTGKLAKFYQNTFCFFKNITLNRAIRSISCDNRQILLFLKKNFVVLVSCLHEFEMCYGCVLRFEKQFNASIKKMER